MSASTMVTVTAPDTQLDGNGAQEAPYTGRRAFWRSGWFACIFFLVATGVFTWPLVTHLANTLPDAQDSVDTSWRFGQIAHNLLTNPLHLYDNPGLYPLNNDLALDEMLVAEGIYVAPIIWLTGNIVLAWNLAAFASYFLSGMAAWLLVRRITGSAMAGLAAGVTLAFSPWHYGEYGHLGIQTIQWMVFALLFLVVFMERSASTARLLDRRTLLYLALFAFFTTLQGLSAGYYGYYEVILFALYLIYYGLRNLGIARWLWGKARRLPVVPVDWRRLAGQTALLIVATVAVLTIMYPFLRPYIDAKNIFGFNRRPDEVEYWSGGLKSLLRTTVTSWWYEPVQQGIFDLRTSSEREMYPGIAALALGLVGLLPRQAKEEASSASIGPGLFAILILVGLILSFGPTLHLDAYGLESTGISLPYKWLYDYVPGFDDLRVPQRFDLFVMLGLGACAGFGIVRLMRWSGGWRLLTPAAVGALALALIMADFFAPGLRFLYIETGGSAPPLYRWLGSADADRVIPKDALLLELPVGLGKTPVNSSPQYLLYGLAHGRPMLNGSPNIIPAGYERLFYEMRRFPSPATLDIIEGLGVKFVIVHTGGLLSDDQRASLEKVAQPGGRLQPIITFPDTNPDGTPAPDSKAVLYRVNPAPQRFAPLKALIPPGSTVLLGDHPSRLRLSTTVLPNLLGPDRRYFITYFTIYSSITRTPSIAKAGEKYDFAVMYKDNDPAQYGYKPSDMVYEDGEANLRVYRKP